MICNIVEIVVIIVNYLLSLLIIHFNGLYSSLNVSIFDYTELNIIFIRNTKDCIKLFIIIEYVIIILTWEDLKFHFLQLSI